MSVLFRVLYLPSLGYCLLIATGAERLSKRIGNKVNAVTPIKTNASFQKFVQYAAFLLLIFMSAKTISRNWVRERVNVIVLNCTMYL